MGGLLKSAGAFGAIGILSKVLGKKKKKDGGVMDGIARAGAARREAAGIAGNTTGTAPGAAAMKPNTPPVMRRPADDEGFGSAFGARASAINDEDARERRRRRVGHKPDSIRDLGGTVHR